MEWLRLYTNIINDPKVMQMPELYRWRYVALLCLFRINNDSLPVEDDIVFSLRLSKKEWEKTENEFKKKGFLVNNTINGWETRQYKSDASKERVKKYRERLKQSYGNGYGNSYNREGILKRDNYSCVYCGSTENICIDHIIPLVSGGSNAPDNLAVACKSCNSGKSGRTPEEAGFSFCNKDAENRYKNNVTVTVTVQEQNRTDTDTDTDTDTNYQNILNCWNSQNIIKHKNLETTPKCGNNKFETTVEKLLKNYTIDEIKQTIKNYGKIVSGEEYYYSHKWTITAFLVRGFEQFKDWDVVKTNYLKKGAIKREYTYDEVCEMVTKHGLNMESDFKRLNNGNFERK